MTDPAGAGGSASLARVVAHSERLGLGITPVHMEAGAATASQAADACGCEVAQIVKSIVFRIGTSDRNALFLTAGDRRVDLSRAAALVGAPLEKTDAAAVRASTGFVIGGVSPLGHLRPIETYLDRNLLRFDIIWAAAGTPNHVFAVSPTALAAALAPTIADFTH